MVTLNLRGRFVNSLLPRKIFWKAVAIGAVSSSSPGVSPVAGQPMMPRMLSIPVWRLERPAASSRAMTSGTFSSVTQRSWICWRVVTSAIGRPDARPASRVISPSSRACAALTMPLGMRTRIMKCPGVGRRWKTPTHLSRSLSSSPSVFQPSRAKRARSSCTSRPSFSAFIASMRFMVTPRGASAPRMP